MWRTIKIFYKTSKILQILPIFDLSSVPIFYLSSVPIFYLSSVPIFYLSSVPFYCTYLVDCTNLPTVDCTQVYRDTQQVKSCSRSSSIMDQQQQQPSNRLSTHAAGQDCESFLPPTTTTTTSSTTAATCSACTNGGQNVMTCTAVIEQSPQVRHTYGTVYLPKELFSRQKDMKNQISPTVKHVWNVAMHALLNIFGFVINTTANHLTQYSLHLLLLKSFMMTSLRMSFQSHQTREVETA